MAGAALTVAVTGCFGGTVKTPTAAVGPGRTAAPRQARHDEAKGQRGDLHIVAVGDTMLGAYPQLPPDPDGYLDPVRRYLRGDLVFGNLEGALTDVAESPKCGDDDDDESCFAFRTPPGYAEYLRRAGFTVMNSANNHSFDFGEVGAADTVAALRRAGIAQSGLPGEIATVTAGGATIAVLGFAPYPRTASLTDIPAARALIERAAAAADVVVVAIHAGAEGADAQHLTGGEETYLGEDRGDPEAFAHMAIDAGADLVLGSGPHVLRAMEVYEGRLIAYSLGNFAGFHNFGTAGVLGDSVILRVALAPDGAFRTGELVPIRLVEAGRPVLDPRGAGAALIAALSRQDLGSRGVRVGPDGVYAPSRKTKSRAGASGAVPFASTSEPPAAIAMYSTPSTS